MIPNQSIANMFHERDALKHPRNPHDMAENTWNFPIIRVSATEWFEFMKITYIMTAFTTGTHLRILKNDNQSQTPLFKNEKIFFILPDST